jgi:subtilase family serine protease
VPTLTRHVPDDVARGIAQRVGAPPPAPTMELTFSLPLRNEDELRALVAAISNPASPEYRHYLSVTDFTARYGPTVADYGSLVRFATANGLHPHALVANRHVLDVDASVANVERALHVTIGLYRRPGAARTFFAPDREPSLDLALPVLHISGLDDATVPVSHLVRGAASDAGFLPPTGSGPDGNFIGSDIRAAYYGGTALTGTGQSVGLFEYAGYNLADVTTYFSTFGQSENVPIVGVSVNNANLRCDLKCDDSEQVLDIEEAISMAPGLKQLVVYVGHSDVSIINQMASDNTSKQLSCSWGWNPDPVELDPIFEEMTAVGGTDVRTHGPGGVWISEIGWAYSGGGPSPDNIPIPPYQVPFVNAKNGGSTTLRNVPDVAGDADTDNYSCYDGGCYPGNGGTSYAAPLWAGYVALANQLAAASNRPPAGFLNPALYALGGGGDYRYAFHDQTLGYNGKYSAVTGFDLVTGFGSPRNDALIEALVRGPK